MRAVLFDAVGTLVAPAAPVAQVYAAAARAHGLRLATDDVASRFRAAFRRQETLDQSLHQNCTSPDREVARWRAIVAEVFHELPTTNKLFARLWQHYARPESWRLYDDVRATFQLLADRGLTIGLASNFDERLPAFWHALSPRANVPVFVSSALGYRKPHPRFFAAIAEQCHLPPAALLMVGDDADNDLRGAQAAGWHAVLIDRTQSPLDELVASALAEQN